MSDPTDLTRTSATLVIHGESCGIEDADLGMSYEIETPCPEPVVVSEDLKERLIPDPNAQAPRYARNFCSAGDYELMQCVDPTTDESREIVVAQMHRPDLDGVEAAGWESFVAVAPHDPVIVAMAFESAQVLEVVERPVFETQVLVAITVSEERPTAEVQRVLVEFAARQDPSDPTAKALRELAIAIAIGDPSREDAPIQKLVALGVPQRAIEIPATAALRASAIAPSTVAPVTPAVQLFEALLGTDVPREAQALAATAAVQDFSEETLSARSGDAQRTGNTGPRAAGTASSPDLTLGGTFDLVITPPDLRPLRRLRLAAVDRERGRGVDPRRPAAVGAATVSEVSAATEAAMALGVALRPTASELVGRLQPESPLKTTLLELARRADKVFADRRLAEEPSGTLMVRVTLKPSETGGLENGGRAEDRGDDTVSNEPAAGPEPRSQRGRAARSAAGGGNFTLTFSLFSGTADQVPIDQWPPVVSPVSPNLFVTLAATDRASELPRPSARTADRAVAGLWGERSEGGGNPGTGGDGLGDPSGRGQDTGSGADDDDGGSGPSDPNDPEEGPDEDDQRPALVS